ncbi:transposase [Brucella intermedia]|uniref:transposase n=1 Tax=Brucella intermedia TaxID=94625 RepID=UPI00046868D5|nr:transposase [Brucella intermedia]
MADETIAAVNETPVEARTAEPVGNTKKTRAPRKKAESKPVKAAAAPAAKTTRAAAKSSSIEAGPATRSIKKYTPEQRASILGAVEKATKGGKTTLKAALQQLEVSEQTYYNWKNAAGKSAPVAAKAKTTAGASDDLKALIALEAENLKLRKELAAKLRAENEELRRRLGQA